MLVEKEETDLSKLYELWKQLEATLDNYEIPKKIEFVKSFSYTKSGKIDRIRTRKLISGS